MSERLMTARLARYRARCGAGGCGVAEFPPEVEAELKTLRAVKLCCVELCKLFEALAACDPEDVDDEDKYGRAMDALWLREADICRRIMTLLPDEFPNGHVPRKTT